MEQSHFILVNGIFKKKKLSLKLFQEQISSASSWIAIFYDKESKHA